MPETMYRPIWTPNPEQVKCSQLFQFMQQLNQTRQLSLTNYDELYDWSVAQPEAFWSAVWQHSGVIASKTATQALEDPEKMPGARWFADAELNFAENLLRFRDDHPAVIFRNETASRRTLSYRELYQQTAQLTAGLSRAGIQPGDIVAGYLPNIPETLVAMLATTALGAVWTSCSPDFGSHGVIDRFGQVKPKLLICADGYQYNGQNIDVLPRVKSISREIQSIEQIIVIPYMQRRPAIASLPNAILWQDVLVPDNDSIDFVQRPFNAPLYILYSSGTTGVPKCIVHGIGGTLLQHLKEHQLHTDIERNDVLFYFTTTGWMMWNWLVSGLASGCTLLLYDGAPFAPTTEHLWQIAEQENISVFGTSAKYISALEKAGVHPVTQCRLPALRTLLSTGSPLAQESYDYVYRSIKSDLMLASISGGTDIIGCFALGCPMRPVYRGELQCRGLGMAVNIYDPSGQPLISGKGELVCEQPFPSMPIYFWDDPEQAKYRQAYFSRYPGIWSHGDYAERTAQDGMIIHGRSDAVLNPGGIRIGTAEIYRQVEHLDWVQEALCIDQPWLDDTRIVLFVVLKDGLTLTAEHEQKIRDTIRQNTTPRHVPQKIIQVADIPRTLSGKIVELAVRNIVTGQPVTNLDALANPEALEAFRDLPQLQE
ncbi:acetoacetate--CoA ligase [Pontibacter sp. JAM-7]|uniref:acetoacetate--CoA ligase n=1 Tax=Pontibacter sp. JAM-7 TaxID=3366581 RepID=UPI003AF5EEFA